MQVEEEDVDHIGVVGEEEEHAAILSSPPVACLCGCCRPIATSNKLHEELPLILSWKIRGAGAISIHEAPGYVFARSSPVKNRGNGENELTALGKPNFWRKLAHWRALTFNF